MTQLFLISRPDASAYQLFSSLCRQALHSPPVLSDSKKGIPCPEWIINPVSFSSPSNSFWLRLHFFCSWLPASSEWKLPQPLHPLKRPLGVKITRDLLGIFYLKIGKLFFKTRTHFQHNYAATSTLFFSLQFSSWVCFTLKAGKTKSNLFLRVRNGTLVKNWK